MGMLAGPPLATHFYNQDPGKALWICVAIFTVAAFLGSQCVFPKESLRTFRTSLQGLLADSVCLFRKYGLYLVSSPLLWGVSGAVSLAAVAFAERMNLGTNVQCTFLYLYLSAGIMAGNVIAPVFKVWRYLLSLLAAGLMAFMTAGLPFFVNWAEPVMTADRLGENFYIFTGVGLILMIIGFLFGLITNYIDSEYLQKVGDDKLEGTGAALQSAFISVFSFMVGSLFGYLLYRGLLSAESQFIWQALLVALLVLPLLMLAVREKGFDEPLRVLLPPFLRLVLSLRYRVKLGNIDYLKEEGGVLFLANHPAEIDPAILTVWLFRRFRPRPMVLETFYRDPVVGPFIRLAGALPVPDSDEGMNDFRMRRVSAAVQGVKQALQNGDSVLLYPAGMLMRDGATKIGGASAVHSILQGERKFRVVLVKTSGLWGSSFSTALTSGRTPDLIKVMSAGLKTLLANLLFFTPRREVNVSFTSAPADFPFNGSRTELNKWLEAWFNRDGKEELKQVSLRFYARKFPPVEDAAQGVEKVDVSAVPAEIKERVCQELGRLASCDPAEIAPETVLGDELGLDSLERGEILSWLAENYAAFDVEAVELKTAGDVMKVAHRGGGSSRLQFRPAPDGWAEDMSKRPAPLVLPGSSVPELFLLSCDRLGNAVAIADESSGVLSWGRLKIAVILLAEYFRRELQREEKVGVLLPSSAGAAIVSMALLLAGKIPVMVNWTLGAKNLEHVEELSGIRVVLSSERFLDKLETVVLGNLENKLLLLEDVRANIGFLDKMRAFLLAKRSAKSLCRRFSLEGIKADDTCVLLFTSGSETVPKGVPLSHANIIANIRDSLTVFAPGATDILYGFLPPFHSFGFTITTMLPLLSGLKTVYHPNPTEYRKLAAGVQSYGVTVLCGTPTFFSGILKAANQAQLQTVRTMIAGAERAPDELFAALSALNPQAVMLEGYGITECSPVVCLNPPGAERSGVGLPLPGVHLLIVDPDSGVELPDGQRGLVLVKGKNVFNGYLGKDAPNPFLEKDGEKWYNTGDLGFLEKGTLILAGRLKRFVKKGGEMISLPALEQALSAKWSPAEEGPLVAVEALEMADGTVKICFFTAVDAALEEANNCLKNAGFSNVARLNERQKLDKIPLLGSGKTDYRALKELMRSRK
jgi:long-chain-fatty-acid--[acyl-carrier-protein] ligase